MLRIASFEMKPGDRVIWLHSQKRSFVIGWRVKRTRGVVEQVCRTRIRIRVRLEGIEKVVNVLPENLMSEAEADDGTMPA